MQGTESYGSMAGRKGPTEAVGLGLPLWLICSVTQRTGTGQQGWGCSAGEGLERWEH